MNDNMQEALQELKRWIETRNQKGSKFDPMMLSIISVLAQEKMIGLYYRKIAPGKVAFSWAFSPEERNEHEEEYKEWTELSPYGATFQSYFW